MTCALKAVKYLLFGFNVLFWITGAVVLAMGIWTKVEPGYFDAFLGDKGYRTPADILLVAGTIVMVVGFLGCCGAVRESKCMLGWFFCFLILIFLAEIAAGILAFIYKDEVKDELKKEMKSLMDSHYGFDHKATFDVDQLQTKLDCCGWDGYKDWSGTTWYKDNINKEVPPSCCRSDKEKPSCYQRSSSFDTAKIYTNGCIRELDDFAQKHLLIIGAIGVAISCVQLIGMMFACALYCTIDY